MLYLQSEAQVEEPGATVFVCSLIISQRHTCSPSHLPLCGSARRVEMRLCFVLPVTLCVRRLPSCFLPLPVEYSYMHFNGNCQRVDAACVLVEM